MDKNKKHPITKPSKNISPKTFKEMFLSNKAKQAVKYQGYYYNMIKTQFTNKYAEMIVNFLKYDADKKTNKNALNQ